MHKYLTLALLMIAAPLIAQYDAHLTGHVLDERTVELTRVKK